MENARRKKSVKGGGGYERINFDVAIVSNPGRPEELIALDEALSKLSLEDPPVVELVKLRYFAGLTLDQHASVAVDLEYRLARRLVFPRIDVGISFPVFAVIRHQQNFLAIGDFQQPAGLLPDRAKRDST